MPDRLVVAQRTQCIVEVGPGTVYLVETTA